MKRYTIDEIREFIADLASPIGPEVFAGYGGEIPSLIHKWRSEKEDPDEGFWYSEKKLEELKNEWALEVDVVSTLEILFGLAKTPPGREFLNNFCDRRKREWEHELLDMIYRVGKRNEELLRKKVNKLSKSSSTKTLADELQRWIDEG